MHVCNAIPDEPKKIKGIIHWVSSKSPKALFEIYDPLYEDSIIVYNPKVTTYEGFVEQFALDLLTKSESNGFNVFQFERLEFFKFDRYDKVDCLYLSESLILLINSMSKHNHLKFDFK